MSGKVTINAQCLFFCVIQLVQVIINTTHLEQSCHFLEEFISNITNVPPDTVNATKLYGTSTFKVHLSSSSYSVNSYFLLSSFYFCHATQTHLSLSHLFCPTLSFLSLYIYSG